MQMQPIMAAYNVTTDHIQQYLDENKSLILKIVESQNSGKLSECAENQSRLQRNLMYLAAIADSQPQPPAIPGGQYTPSGVMHHGAHYMQAQQITQQQQQLLAARSSLIYSQQPFSLLQHHQPLHAQLATTSASTGLHIYPSEAAVGSGGFPDFGRGLAGSGKQLEIGGSSGGEAGHSGERSEALYLKPASDNNDGN